ncbi:hypothetical protein [Vibrio rhizosphaerae]|uniref:hypothetical protein n=1 Tax=Vibrio rhizosphaerae TaxID=398736 RepID=UPI000571771C|nr:hypothetical protein [Vibrio rhizosphaerae]
MFQEFDNYLNSLFSSDYWADEGISIAENMLSKFSNTDWDMLKDSVGFRDSKWLVKCAEVLGENESSIAFNILMKIAINDNLEVKIAALDSINSLFDYISDSDLDGLKDVIDGVDVLDSHVTRMMLNSLERKINQR